MTRWFRLRACLAIITDYLKDAPQHYEGNSYSRQPYAYFESPNVAWSRDWNRYDSPAFQVLAFVCKIKFCKKEPNQKSANEG